MAAASFECACGQIKGEVTALPQAGNHLVCYCDSCRAGALYCGADLPQGTPVDLYLTPPQHVSISQGQAQLAPFVFSPKGIIRWKAACCGVQMFSSQPDPRTAFMSVRTDRLANSNAAGPVVTKAFVPKVNGKTAIEGKLALAKLIFAAVVARLTGQWRKTPLYDSGTRTPIAAPILISRAEKEALLQNN